MMWIITVLSSVRPLLLVIRSTNVTPEQREYHNLAQAACFLLKKMKSLVIHSQFQSIGPSLEVSTSDGITLRLRSGLHGIETQIASTSSPLIDKDNKPLLCFRPL